MKPVDGLNVFAMSLGDVLYDPETQRYYVTNTGKQVDMQSINPAAETQSIDDAEGDSEERYNHNHGSDGRFTTGAGSSGVDNDRKGGKIGVGRKTKYAPSPQRQHKGLQLKPEEYGMVCGELKTRYKNAEAGSVKYVCVGNYSYLVEPDGHGGCIVRTKISMKNTGRR